MTSHTRRTIDRVVKRVGPEHPITVEAAGKRVVVRAGQQVVVDTDHALVLREAGYAPVYYFPVSTIDSALLQPSSTHTYCPYKGEASYYSLVTDEGVVADAAWWYPEPYPDVAPIAGHVAFYPNRVAISGE